MIINNVVQASKTCFLNIWYIHIVMTKEKLTNRIQNNNNGDPNFFGYAGYLFCKSCLLIEEMANTQKGSASALFQNTNILNPKEFDIFVNILKKYRGLFIHSNYWEINTKEKILSEIADLFDQIKNNKIFQAMSIEDNKCFLSQFNIVKILSFVQDNSSINILLNKSNLTDQQKKDCISLRWHKKLFIYKPYKYLTLLEQCHSLFFGLKHKGGYNSYKKAINKTIVNFIKFSRDFILFVSKDLFTLNKKYEISFGKESRKINRNILYRYNTKLSDKEAFRWRDIKIFCNFTSKGGKLKFENFFISLEVLCKVIDLIIKNKCVDNEWIYIDICKRYRKISNLKKYQYKYNLSKTYKDYDPFKEIGNKHSNLHVKYKKIKQTLAIHYEKMFDFLFKQLIVFLVAQHDSKIKIDDSKFTIKRKGKKIYSYRLTFIDEKEIDFSLKQFRASHYFVLHSLSQWITNLFSSNYSSTKTLNYKTEKNFIDDHCNVISRFKKNRR